MSGKKSCEVAAVLSRGEEIRQEADGVYLGRIEKHARSMESDLKILQDLKKGMKALSIKASTEAASMFGTEAKRLEKNFLACKKAVEDTRLATDTPKDCRQEAASIQQEARQADQEAARIRQKIQDHPHYCDTEYREAQDVLAQYQALRERLQNLQARAAEADAQQKKQINQLNAKTEQAKNACRQIEEMNKTAKNRMESDAMRQNLKEALQGIDAAQARKFLKVDYETLLKEADALCAKADETVLQEFSPLYAKIADFQSQLTEKVAIWQQQKKDAEDALQRVRGLVNISYAEPIDYINKGADGARTPLFAYLKQYGRQDRQGDYESAMKTAEKQIAAEDFLAAVDTLQGAEKLLEELRSTALDLQEAMLQKAELAAAMQTVMADLRYDVTMEIIDDNPNDGFRMVCSIGDEIIDFEKIDIDDDGKIVVDVDHQEARGGTCGVSMREIVSKMRHAGIPMTNVLKDGRSILEPPKQQMNQHAPAPRMRSHS